MAREEGFRTGKQAAGSKPTPSAAAGGEDVSTKVKGIMNQAYQMMASEFKKKESFETQQILKIVVTTIKVKYL